MANQVSFKVLVISFSKTCNAVALSCVHCKLLVYTTCALVSCVISLIAQLRTDFTGRF